MIDNFLESRVSPERREVVVECVASLEEMNYTAALDELNSILLISDDIDTLNTLGRIEAVIDTAQSHFINTYGILLIPGLSQYNKQFIVKCLANLEYYILPDQIELLLMGDYDNETILAKLVELLEGFDSEELIGNIHTVPDSFVDGLKALVKEQLMLRASVEEYTTPVSRIRLINKLMGAFSREHFSIALELIESGKRIGSALRPLIDDHIGILDTLTPEQLAYQMTGLVFISDVVTDELDKAITEELEGFSDIAYEKKVMLETFRLIQNTVLKDKGV